MTKRKMYIKIKRPSIILLCSVALCVFMVLVEYFYFNFIPGLVFWTIFGTAILTYAIIKPETVEKEVYSK